MKKNIAMKWVKALESGDYKQGRERLRSKSNKFCCLGVLCNIHAQENPKFAKKMKDNLSYGTDGFGTPEGGVLPVEVMEWAGMENTDGKYASFIPSLIELNDGGVNFEKIAQTIKDNWKSL